MVYTMYLNIQLCSIFRRENNELNTRLQQAITSLERREDSRGTQE